MPWSLFQQLAPGLAVTHPLRLAVPALIVAIGLAARALEELLPDRRALLVVGLVAADGTLLSRSPWPLLTSDSAAPAVYEAMVRAEDEPLCHGILDLPTDGGLTMSSSRYLVFQAHHRRPIPYAPDVRASTSVLIHEAAFRRLAALSSRRADEQARLGLSRSSGDTDVRRLREMGYRWIVLHPRIGRDAAARLQAELESALGPGTAVGEELYWELGIPPAEPEYREPDQPVPPNFTPASPVIDPSHSSERPLLQPVDHQVLPMPAGPNAPPFSEPGPVAPDGSPN
jgi:hypothetical protein